MVIVSTGHRKLALQRSLFAFVTVQTPGLATTTKPFPFFW